MNPVEKKSIFFSGSTLQRPPQRPKTLGNQKRRRKGQEILLSFPWTITGDTGRNTFDLDCPKKDTVVSDQSDRINDQEHKKTGEQKKDLLEKNNPSATEKKREQSS